ncbi:MAG: GGDEF domain-containing phosphodiesterase [Bacteroides sp.]|nr:GGDEF domain-containing phosphodiesterase [Prevotella sp.]MCM1408383.1 GGDEF domain-containing phosphodiesterase [Treponema brennaborense]MCM1470386.1 GGDEF domain-containing phosphodiesterase [Bacteroides sp.]
MAYNISYDICAVILLAVVLCLHYFRKPTPVFQNKIFSYIVWLAVFAALADIACALAVMNVSACSRTLLYAVHIVYLLAVNFLPVLTVIYILSLPNQEQPIFGTKYGIYAKAALIVPYCVCSALILLSPAAPLAFRIAPDTHLYERLGAMNILYGIGGYFLLLALASLTLINRKKRKADQIAPIIFCIPAAAGILVQMFYSEQLVQNFGISISLLLAAVFIQKPEERINTNTGLFNKTAFMTQIDRALSSKKSFYALGVILDELPFLNTTYGYVFINKILRKVADFLLQIPDGTVFHINQRTFCMEIRRSPNKKNDSEYIAGIMRSIEQRFSAAFSIDDGRKVRLFVRQCLIACPEDAVNDADAEERQKFDAESIINIFDIAATEPRYLHMKRISAANIDISIQRRRQYIEHAIKTALQNDRLAVYYQPIFSTKEKQIIGAEALIRLKDPDGNFISPEEFIPIAEENGYILHIGEYIFEQVCLFLKTTDLQLYNIKKIDVNLSVIQCLHPQLVEQILSIMKEYEAPAQILNLEITETAAATSHDILKKNMQQLANSGIELSLDDYGSGYSNLNYLLNFPFKMIKLDKEIVWKAFFDEKANTVLTSTINMINALDMTVLAEGVETKEQADWLTELGCDYLQGFYFSKPLPKDGFFELLKKVNKIEKHPQTGKPVISCSLTPPKTSKRRPQSSTIEELAPAD